MGLAGAMGQWGDGFKLGEAHLQKGRLGYELLRGGFMGNVRGAAGVMWGRCLSLSVI